MINNEVISQVSIETIGHLLDEGKAKEALNLVNYVNHHSPAWENAKGVCLLRLRMFDAACAIFRSLVFPDNCISVPADVPALYRANFATAMLLAGHKDSALAVLEHMDTNGHPYVTQFLTEVNRWKESLSLLERMGLAIGWYSKRPFHCECPPGGI
jgi:hypothetical protein